MSHDISYGDGLMDTLMDLTVSVPPTETNADILGRISSKVEQLGEDGDWPPRLVYLVDLTLEELGLNALTHGREHGLDELSISIRSSTDSVVIELLDNGAPFDPLTDAPIPDSDAPLESRPVGGLGIYLIRNMVDEAHYKRADGRNCLTLITRRNQ